MNSNQFWRWRPLRTWPEAPDPAGPSVINGSLFLCHVSRISGLGAAGRAEAGLDFRAVV
jgi:hypothetical protein